MSDNNTSPSIPWYKRAWDMKEDILLYAIMIAVISFVLITCHAIVTVGELETKVTRLQTQLDDARNTLGGRVTTIENGNGSDLAMTLGKKVNKRQPTDSQQATVADWLNGFNNNFATLDKRTCSEDDILGMLYRHSNKYGGQALLALIEEHDTDQDGVLNETDICPTVHWDAAPDVQNDYNGDGCADPEDVSGVLATLGITKFGGWHTNAADKTLAYWHAKRGEREYYVVCVPLAADQSPFRIGFADMSEATKKTPPPLVGKCWLEGGG